MFFYDFLFRKKLKAHIFQIKSFLPTLLVFYPPLLVFTPPLSPFVPMWHQKRRKIRFYGRLLPKERVKDVWARSRTFDLKSMNLQLSFELKILSLAQKLTKIDSVEKCEFSKFWRKNVNFLYLSFIHVTF